MNDFSQTPALASVLCLRLIDFARKPVAEQARLRAQLEAAVAVALTGLTPVDRIVLDAPDGLCLVILEDAPAALALAGRCRSAAAGLPLAIGANYGPIALAGDSEHGPSLAGDGLRSASVASAFAQSGQLLVTRAFSEALAAQAPAQQALQPAGMFSDASLRTHELFLADPASAPAGRRRPLLLAALGSLLLLIGAGALRWSGALDPPAIVLLEVTPGGEVHVDGELRGRAPALARLELRPGPHLFELRHAGAETYRVATELRAGQEYTLRHAFVIPAVLNFEISPGGRVFVDGEARGSLPALKRLELPAGRHRIEVRHAGYAPLQLDVTLDPGEEAVIRHRFGEPPRKDAPGLIERLKKKLRWD